MSARNRGFVQSKTVVIALGGNALAQPGEEGTITQQFRHTRESLGAVVELAREGWHIAIVHGNGPQVGNELIRNEQSRHLLPPLPLGVLVASTEGWIGYMIQQSLQNALRRAGVRRQVVTMVTQVLVDPDDPELQRPTKPIGRTMDEATARSLAAELGGEVAETKGGWRRVVPSPRPTAIVEREMIRALVAQGHLVIAAGGGTAGRREQQRPGRGLLAQRQRCGEQHRRQNRNNRYDHQQFDQCECDEAKLKNQRRRTMRSWSKCTRPR